MTHQRSLHLSLLISFSIAHSPPQHLPSLSTTLTLPPPHVSLLFFSALDSLLPCFSLSSFLSAPFTWCNMLRALRSRHLHRDPIRLAGQETRFLWAQATKLTSEMKLTTTSEI